MTDDDPTKRLAEITRSLGYQSAIEASERIAKTFEDPSIRALMAAADSHAEMFRTALGPMEEIRRISESLDWTRNVFADYEAQSNQMRQVFADMESRFRFPVSEELLRINEQIQGSLRGLADTVRPFAEALRTPWLDNAHAMESLSGVATLRGISQSIGGMSAFGDDLSESLRASLGDWRDPIKWPEGIFSDISARGAFYEARGFDPSLTNFPAPAFREIAFGVGLAKDIPAIVVGYGPPIPPESGPDEEADLARANSAHDWIQRIERQLRRFIDHAMTVVHGSDWPKHRLPNGLYDQWRDKKLKGQAQGEGDLPLIAYADFTDYERIICKTDNWREVFMRVFKRPETVRETLQRLYPIRICTMHSRPVTQDDQLLLYVEVRRLVKTIKDHLPRPAP